MNFVGEVDQVNMTDPVAMELAALLPGSWTNIYARKKKRKK